MDGNTQLSRFSTFAILLVPLLWLYETSAVAPALGAIAEAFPGASDLELKLVLVMPFLTIFVFSIVSGFLCRYFDKKNIMIFGLIIYGITGVLPAFADDISTILVLRFITGIGVGLTLPLTNALITENYDHPKRNRLLSYAMGVANLGNVGISIIVGALLVFGWQVSFYSFFVVFIVLLFVILGVPKSPPLKERNPETGIEHAQGKLPIIVLWLALFMIFNWAIFTIAPTNIALFMTTEKLGEPWIIGLVISLPAAGSIVASLILSEMEKIFGKFVLFIAFMVFGIGFFLLVSAYSLPLLMAGSLLVGLGSGIVPPVILHLTAAKVEAAHRALAFGVVTSCIHLGAFASPFVQLIISELGNNPSQRYLFFVAGIITAIASIIALLHGLRSKKAVEITV